MIFSFYKYCTSLQCEIVVSHIAISIKCHLIVQPYYYMLDLLTHNVEEGLKEKRLKEKRQVCVVMRIRSHKLFSMDACAVLITVGCFSSA